MKLIKINTDHYVIVDDLKIKEGDWFYNPATKEVLYASKDMLSWNSDTSQEHKGWKKITRSTQPLNTKFNDWFDAQIITLLEVKELIGEVDVEKKANEAFPIGTWSSDAVALGFDMYKIGYNQALEDNKEKKYTLEDMLNAHYIGWIDRGESRNVEYPKARNLFKLSLQPKTEWDVEFDKQGKLKLV